jgi:uncharacterized protein (TIGR02147 family)
MVNHIQNVFLERCRSNEQYSLRAFARSLNVPVSSLSEIMNEKRPMTKRLRNKIGSALHMSDEQIQAFELKEKATSPQNSLEADYRQLALDSFYIISEWYHYGILQLMRTKGFKHDPKWMAQRLGIHPQDVEVALERLKRIGVIQEKAGKLIDITKGKTSHIRSDFTNEQLKSFQIKAMEKSIVAVKEVPIQFRDNTSMTMAISKKAMPFAKEEIKKFRRKLTKKLEEYDTPDEVYQLIISLTPLTNIEEII